MSKNAPRNHGQRPLFPALARSQKAYEDAIKLEQRLYRKFHRQLAEMFPQTYILRFLREDRTQASGRILGVTWMGERERFLGILVYLLPQKPSDPDPTCFVRLEQVLKPPSRRARCPNCELTNSGEFVRQCEPCQEEDATPCIIPGQQYLWTNPKDPADTEIVHVVNERPISGEIRAFMVCNAKGEGGMVYETELSNPPK